MTAGSRSERPQDKLKEPGVKQRGDGAAAGQRQGEAEEATPASGIKAQMVAITPKIAGSLLGRNTHNRSVVQARIDQYAADMSKGDWQVNGEAIKVSADGEILDGQHRLMAIIESGVTVTTLLITGLPAEAQETMDQGRNRSFGDVLKLRGERDYYNLAAAVRMVCLYERDGVPFTAGRPAPTVKQLSRTLSRNPEIRDSVKLASSARRAWLTVSIVAATHYLFSIASREDADDFIVKVATGENIAAGHPAYVLRERLIKEHDTNGIHHRVKVAFIIRAWNAYRAGETLVRLAWTPGGTAPDRFPAIDGLAEQVSGRAGESSQPSARPSSNSAAVLPLPTAAQHAAARAALEASA